MRKILIVFLTLFCFIPVWAEESAGGGDEIFMIIEIDGHRYNIRDYRILEALALSDSCIGGVTNGNIADLYKILYEACYPSIPGLREEIAKLDNEYIVGDLTSKAAGFVISFGRKLDYKIYEKTRNRVPDKLQNTKLGKYQYRSLYGDCILTRNRLRVVLNFFEERGAREKYEAKFNADIDSCINAINVEEVSTDDNPYAFMYQETCPAMFTVAKYDLENIQDLNAEYRGKSFHFYKDIKFNPSGKVLVTNGNVLVACEGGQVKDIVKPVFSGREACQDGRYSMIPGIGGTPNGLYVLRREEQDEFSEESDKYQSYGKYRIPLIPAIETDTGGRTNMYLHGSPDPQKRRSSGCVSLGIGIEKFIEKEFIDGDIPLIVKVGKVYQDWKGADIDK